MNSVNLVGTLAQAPRVLPAEHTAACTLGRVCVEELGKNGEVYKTFIPIKAFGTAAEALKPLTAGTLVAVNGKLRWDAAPDGASKRPGGGSLVVTVFHLACLTTEAPV